MTIIWEDSIIEERIAAVANYFGVSKEMAERAVNAGLTDIDEIRAYLESLGELKENNIQHKCLCCGRPISDPISVRRGYGEECFRRVQLGLYAGIFEELAKKDVES